MKTINECISSKDISSRKNGIAHPCKIFLYLFAQKACLKLYCMLYWPCDHLASAAENVTPSSMPHSLLPRLMRK